jgi:hypothetical protein
MSASIWKNLNTNPGKIDGQSYKASIFISPDTRLREPVSSFLIQSSDNQILLQQPLTDTNGLRLMSVGATPKEQTDIFTTSITISEGLTPIMDLPIARQRVVDPSGYEIGKSISDKRSLLLAGGEEGQPLPKRQGFSIASDQPKEIEEGQPLPKRQDTKPEPLPKRRGFSIASDQPKEIEEGQPLPKRQDTKPKPLPIRREQPSYDDMSELEPEPSPRKQPSDDVIPKLEPEPSPEVVLITNSQKILDKYDELEEKDKKRLNEIFKDLQPSSLFGLGSKKSVKDLQEDFKSKKYEKEYMEYLEKAVNSLLKEKKAESEKRAEKFEDELKTDTNNAVVNDEKLDKEIEKEDEKSDKEKEIKIFGVPINDFIININDFIIKSVDRTNGDIKLLSDLSGIRKNSGFTKKGQMKVDEINKIWSTLSESQKQEILNALK